MLPGRRSLVLRWAGGSRGVVSAGIAALATGLAVALVTVLDTLLAQNRAKDSAAFRSLALQLRRNGHDYRRWSIEHAAAGHAEAAAIFAARANRYAQDALWYWRRARQI